MAAGRVAVPAGKDALAGSPGIIGTPKHVRVHDNETRGDRA
jgi:hypothetical protein